MSKGNALLISHGDPRGGHPNLGRLQWPLYNTVLTDAVPNFRELNGVSRFWRNGRRWYPIAGEVHLARLPASQWREELLRMKVRRMTSTSVCPAFPRLLPTTPSPRCRVAWSTSRCLLGASC